MADPILTVWTNGNIPVAVLRSVDDFGIVEVDTVSPPQRFWDDDRSSAPPLLTLGLDLKRLNPNDSPVALLQRLPTGDTWSGITRRTIARLLAWFLVCEDRQSRLRVQNVSTLAHQASLVSHVLSRPNLARVLIADEVGLGKTVEAGLIVKALLDQDPGLRVLYLAPARLVSNVRREFDRLELPFRQWVSSSDRDATLRDQLVIASLHRAAHEAHYDDIINTPPWDLLIVDECHHLSAWEAGGGKAAKQYQLVRELIRRQRPGARLVLLSGTPHQGHRERFNNLLELLKMEDETLKDLAGRVIYRTKEDVRDWFGNPMFPSRQVNVPHVVDLGAEHHQWLAHIHEFYVPAENGGKRRRAAGWRCAQALQWASSSVQAGLGYLVRQAIRAGWGADRRELRNALGAIRPYRLGPDNEQIESLFERIRREVGQQVDSNDLADIEVLADDEIRWEPDPVLLGQLLDEGVALCTAVGDRKWEQIEEQCLIPAGDEKVVLFAQPVETVTALARFLRLRYGVDPALIIGNQGDDERQEIIQSFWRPDGPQFLVSSRAGGEGINLQIARRLVHVDVPWNPMDLEQRVGRVHRFGSRRRIIVDTVVAKDSREVDMYRVAHAKLAEVAATLVPEEKFEALFSRVMALVPPEELTAVMERGAHAPLSPEEQGRIADLVSEGFARWSEFHEQYSQQHLEVLDPGEANWGDVAIFAHHCLGATAEPGAEVLQFRWVDGEIEDTTIAADVIRLRDGSAYVCGDFAGMPIVGANGDRLPMLGLNVSVIARALREVGLPGKTAGPAHVKLPAERLVSFGGTDVPAGIWIAARVSIDVSGQPPREVSTQLSGYVVSERSGVVALEGAQLGEVVRLLVDGGVRREPVPADAIIRMLAEREAEWIRSLRTPSESDRKAGIRHAVFPLAAIVIT